MNGTVARAVIVVVAAAAVAFAVLLGFRVVRGGSVASAPAPVAATFVDVKFGVPTAFVRMETFAKRECPNGRAVSFFFADHNIRSQYICETNVADVQTERSRRVDRSQEYSFVTFWRMVDKKLDGWKASNVEIIRYDLELRAPLKPVPHPRTGGAHR